MTTQKLAQNKIDYIVFHRPKEAGQLLYDYGYEIPKEPKALTGSIKALIRKEGRKVTEALLELHPDTKAILAIKSTKKSNCSACNNKTYNNDSDNCESCGHSGYIGSGDEYSFLGQFDSYNDSELEKYYRGIVTKSNKTPENKNLAQEVQLIWNELRQRKQQEQQEKITKVSKGISKDDMILLGMVFIAGILVGHGLKKNMMYGK